MEDIVLMKTNVVVQQKTKLIVQQKTKLIVQQNTKWHTPFRERGNEASIRVPRMFKSHV
jgi:hypothetical protein